MIATRGGRYSGTPQDLQSAFVRQFLGFVGHRRRRVRLRRGPRARRRERAAAIAEADRRLDAARRLSGHAAGHATSRSYSHVSRSLQRSTSMHTYEKAADLAGRILISAMFLTAGLGKICGLRGHAGLHGLGRRPRRAAAARDRARSARRHRDHRRLPHAHRGRDCSRHSRSRPPCCSTRATTRCSSCCS